MIRRYTEYSLKSHNTFGIDVKAAQFYEFESEEDLCEIIGNGLTQPFLVIGGGSNLLFMNDYNGTVLHSQISGVEIVSDNETEVLLRVGSGINWDSFVAYTVENGWQGLENLSAIPGEVGASAVQNVGAYGVEAGELIHSVDAVSIIDGCKRCFSHDECCFSYRNSVFKMEERNKYVITFVTYRLRKKPVYRLEYGNLRVMAQANGAVTVAGIRNAVKEIRAAKLPDPSDLGSAGSFFMNPIVEKEQAEELLNIYPQMPHYDATEGKTKLSAAWLIDKCGWKEKRCGNVSVYCNQPLVIVNYGGATGADVLKFSLEVCASVKEKFGVQLNREVNVIE